jgi:hypothetical protein
VIPENWMDAMTTIDPYQPPQTDGAPIAPLDRAHSRAPKVFGVLSIVFSSLTLIGSLLGALGGAMSTALRNVEVPDNPKFAEARSMVQGLARIYRIIGVQSLMIALLSVALLVIGIGQLRYRAWARRFSLYWGGTALGAVAGMVLISVMLLGPAYHDLMTAAARTVRSRATVAPEMGLDVLMGGSAAVLEVLLYAPYPILLLVFFSRDRVRAAMTR